MKDNAATRSIRYRHLYNTKTKKQLIEMILEQKSTKRIKIEELINILYQLEKLKIIVEATVSLPLSEQNEIWPLLREIEKILKFNLEEIQKEESEF